MKKFTRITTRFTEQEFASIKAALDAVGLPAADFVRKASVAAALMVKKNRGRILLPLDFEETFITKTKGKK